ALKRGGYDELVEAELTAHMRARASAFDAIVSADTLVYFRDLREVLAAAAQALRPGGWLAFSVEALADDAVHEGGVELGPSGSYRHALAHVRHAVVAASLADIRIQAQERRKEVRRAVNGWVALGRRPD